MNPGYPFIDQDGNVTVTGWTAGILILWTWSFMLGRDHARKRESKGKKVKKR